MKPKVEIQSYSLIATPWGVVAAVWSDAGLWELSFPRPDPGEALAAIRSRPLPPAEAAPEDWTESLRQDLNAYFRGFAADFGATPVDWRGYTLFQAAVLRYTRTIPYGTTVTYGQTAQAAGRPKAARAAGGALHINRTPLVVPCHRVVGAGGALTGFGGGLELKQALLLLEGVAV